MRTRGRFVLVPETLNSCKLDPFSNLITTFCLLTQGNKNLHSNVCYDYTSLLFNLFFLVKALNYAKHS